jgi:hypothetical protein
MHGTCSVRVGFSFMPLSVSTSASVLAPDSLIPFLPLTAVSTAAFTASHVRWKGVGNDANTLIAC